MLRHVHVACENVNSFHCWILDCAYSINATYFIVHLCFHAKFHWSILVLLLLLLLFDYLSHFPIEMQCFFSLKTYDQHNVLLSVVISMVMTSKMQHEL